MATPMVGELQLAGATFRIRFVSQRRRDEISEQCRTRKPGDLLPETDLAKLSDLLAVETIGGWSNLTPLDALELGYEDFEALPTDGDGNVPFSEDTAKKLYRGCLWAHFRSPIDDCSLNLAREVARAKKRAAA